MYIKLFIASVVFAFLMIAGGCQSENTPLDGRVIVIDPGHGGTAETDYYRVGPAGEREEWINLRVALKLETLLSEKGATVLMTRTDDSDIDLEERAMLAIDNEAHLFVSVHHNAIADTTVNFPVVYYHGNASENEASVRLGEILGREINNALFNGEKTVLIASDHTIFPNAGTAVLRHSYGIPGVITEASFFTNPAEELRLKDRDYNLKEAQALLRGIISFFEEDHPPIREKYSTGQLPPFRALQAAGRMSEEVLEWKQAYEKAEKLIESDEISDIEKALDYATRSVRLYPDSPSGKQAHLIRAEALEKLGKTEEAETAKRRAEEFYRFIEPH
jgi:N-acetylmuramoyl-L-alanine amidase